MAPLDDTTQATRFDSFRVHRTCYKKIGNHEIDVGILVPRDLKPGKHPLMVKFHGGGLVLGDCLYPDWVSAFFIPFIHRTSSIVILPNYRLTPEHSGTDILSDLSDFWTWFHNRHLDTILPDLASSLDYERVMVTGESAGGYMALMSGLIQPTDSFRAILAQYPMTNYLRREPTDMLFGQPTPGVELIDKHISAITRGTVISSAVPPERFDLSYALSAYNQYLTYFGSDPKLWPIRLIEDAKSMPPTWIIHGEADTAVDVKDSRDFVQTWTKKEVRGEVRLSVVPGQEHGFDVDLKESEEEWLREGLEWVEAKWLR